MFRAVLFALTVFVTAGAAAEDDQLLIESTLRRWEQTAQDCRSLEARVTLFNSDVMEQSPKISRGRFLYQAFGESRWHIEKVGGFVWRKDTLTWIELDRDRFQQFSAGAIAERQRRESDLSRRDRSWWEGFELGFLRILPLEPTKMIPHLLEPNRETFAADHELSIGPLDGGVVLHGKAKLPEVCGYENIYFLFRPGVGLPQAVRVCRDSRDYTTYSLEDVRVNETPTDLEAFLHPDLKGLRLIDHP